MILRVLHFQGWINPFSVKIWRHTSYRDVSILTYFVLCVVLIWLYIIIINRRRRIAVTLDGTSETRPPFVACLHAIRDLFLLMITPSSIRPQHTTRKECSLPHHSFEVSYDTNGLVNPTQGAGREIILQ